MMRISRADERVSTPPSPAPASRRARQPPLQIVFAILGLGMAPQQQIHRLVLRKNPASSLSKVTSAFHSIRRIELACSPATQAAIIGLFVASCPTMMRVSSSLALLLSALLAACASDKDSAGQEGHFTAAATLKVHPGLLSSPAAPRATPVATPVPATAMPPEAPAEQPSAR
jgi:hypothetical protein